MISLKNEMAVMKTNAEDIRKSTSDLRHEDKKMLNEIEQMKHVQNDTSETIINVQHEHKRMLNEIKQMKHEHNNTSEMIINVQHEHDKMLSEIEQKMKINQNDTSEMIVNVQHEYKTIVSEIAQKMKYNHNVTSERIVNVQDYLLNVNNSVDLLRNHTEKINAKYGIQENRTRELSIQQEKIESRLNELHNNQRQLSETQGMIANHSKNTLEKILKMREDLEGNITSMVSYLTLTRQDFPDSQTSRPSTSTGTTTKPTSTPLRRPMDCYDLYTSGNTRSRVYTVYPWGATKQSVSVYCEMDVMPGGWTVFQRRGIDKSVLFNRTWLEYKKGFGSIYTDFWLGNEVIHQMTTIGSNKLYIQLKDTSLRSFHARFESFSIGPETDKYRLHVAGKFSGNMTYDYVTSGSYILNGQPFATPDRPDTSHCATRLAGGWWFHGCEYVYLNGPFNSRYWVWKGSINYYNLLEYTSMMMTRG
ncbi:fibroleukin-like [Saccostrea echinata]|uniref:fibroleukin-like n=1 Tax=Saccostrea echinata TaxID=191078 RepID=UPI002A8382A3|nr:fibroleukin-like [Saccostrea echinata]